MKADRTNQQHLPLFLFGGITLLGVFFICLTKLTGVPPLWSMLIPIALMIGYWFLSWYLKRGRLHNEQTGDNLYYMGFLFTLTSLGVSLYQFTSQGSMDDVIRNFGIAITSTICGIAMRILYNQTRRDVLDIERSTRHDLASMTRQVRTEMDSMRREFVDFRRVNHQMVVEGITEIMDATKETAAKVRETMEQMVSESMKPLEEASQKFGETLGTSLSEISSKLTVVVEKIEATTKTMESVVLPEAVIKNDFAPLVKEMGTTLSEHSAIVRISGQSQNQQTKAISESVGKLVDQMSKTMVMLEKSVQANSQAIQSNAALNQRVEQSNSTQRQMLERIMQARPQPPVMFTTGGIPARPVNAASLNSPANPSPLPLPRQPSQPAGFHTMNSASFQLSAASTARAPATVRSLSETGSTPSAEEVRSKS